MHRELSTRGGRAPGPEAPTPERRVPKARTQARRVALRRWPRRKATPNRRPGTVGRLRAYLPRAPSTLGPRARRCPDSKKKPPTVEWLGFVIVVSTAPRRGYGIVSMTQGVSPRVSHLAYRHPRHHMTTHVHTALRHFGSRAHSNTPESHAHSDGGTPSKNAHGTRASRCTSQNLTLGALSQP